MTTTTLKIQQDDASKWDVLPLKGSHHKDHLTDKLKSFKEKVIHNTKVDT
jgi:hypothetical protein